MKISQVTVHNYRNLDGVEVLLNPTISFLVGENELGKSNFLDLLDILFNRRGFSEEDFFDPRMPIKVEFSLLLSEVEKGNFEDVFDPTDSERINVIARQEYSEINERITFLWKENRDENPTEIPSAVFRRVNFIKYDSLRTPRDELTFHRGRGGSRFLSYLVQEFTRLNGDGVEREYLVEDNLESLVAHIEGVFRRIKPFRTHGIGIFTDAENPVDLLCRVLKLKGPDEFDIQRSGYGVQFSVLIVLSILERLMYLRQSRRWEGNIFTSKRLHFAKQEYTDFVRRFPHADNILKPFLKEDNDKFHIDVDKISDEQRERLGEDAANEVMWERSISLILGLDEPEIHLHPYMQRNLVKYFCSLLDNRDSEFSSLLREIFGIDLISGQAIIVSHSPNVLFDDYRHIVRFYKRDDVVGTVSGMGVQADAQMEKHLLMNLPYIKEAFFSRCVIVVEGETEAGAVPVWANKVIGDPDEFGIIVINAQGVGSVPPIVKLLGELRVPSVSIVDRDRYSDEEHGSVDGLRPTEKRDFEEELFDAVCSHDHSVSALFEMLEEYDTIGLDRYVRKASLAQIAERYDIDPTWHTLIRTDRCRFSDILKGRDSNLLKAMFLSWLSQSKGLAFGRFLGERIAGHLIPEVYRKLVEDARSRAERSNVDGRRTQEDSAVPHS